MSAENSADRPIVLLAGRREENRKARLEQGGAGIALERAGVDAFGVVIVFLLRLEVGPLTFGR